LLTWQALMDDKSLQESSINPLILDDINGNIEKRLI
jgi:hypothetical protein